MAPPLPAHPSAIAPTEPGSTEDNSKAYVAPVALPKIAVPTDPEPEAKVVLNLPTEPVATVGEDEVRAARARRRTATVKIERSAVTDTLKVADLAAAAAQAHDEDYPATDAPPVAASPHAAALEAAAAPTPIPADRLPTPRARLAEPAHAPPIGAPPQTPSPFTAIASERDIDVEVEAPPPKKSFGRMVGLGLVVALAAGGLYVTQSGPGGAAPASTSTPEAAPTARATAATPSPAPSAAETAVGAETSTTAGAATAHPPFKPEAKSDAKAEAIPIHSAAPRVAAPAPPRPPRPPPAVKPAKPKGDIPSEI